LRRILVTGAGGVGGINFVRALKSTFEDIYIVGTDYHYHYLLLSPVDERYKTPRHDDPNFIPLIRSIIKKHDIVFVHPQPEVEVEVLSQNKDSIPAKMLVPPPDVIKVARDKYLTYLKLKERNVPVPKTFLCSSEEDIPDLVNKLGDKAWIRVRKGAGGKLSLPINTPEEAKLWVKLWCIKNIVTLEDFIVQEYLPGRDLAWDSLWYKGKLIASYTRERLAYIFPHVSPSRITGTPTIARIVHNDEVNRVAIKAVKAIDPCPSGFYCIDLKEDENGTPKITEVNIKAHTTLALWSYAAVKALRMDPIFNIPYLYLKLGLDEDDEVIELGTDIYPEGLTLIRHLDAGVILLTPQEERIRVL